MTTTAPSPYVPRSSSPSSGGVVAIVIGGLVAVGAILAATLGALALWGDGKKDADGYLATGTDHYETMTHALMTDDLDFDAVYPGFDGDPFGKVRLQATSRDGKPVFVGIARTEDAAKYLAGTRYTDVTDVDYDPFDPTYRDYTGSVPARPGDQDIWVASAEGSGKQTVDWKAKDGDYSVVVMNADASSSVDVGVRAGAELGFLRDLGYGLLGGGLLALALGAGVIVAGVRSRD